MFVFFFFQAEDGIRDLVRSRGLGDVYKRQWLLHFITASASKTGFRIFFTEATAPASRVFPSIMLSLIHI